MDREYEYFPSGVSHHHGFLSHRSGEYADPMAQERMRKFQIADCRLQNLGANLKSEI